MPVMAGHTLHPVDSLKFHAGHPSFYFRGRHGELRYLTRRSKRQWPLLAKWLNLKDVYNLLYVVRDNEEGAAYELARDLYSSLRQFLDQQDAADESIEQDRAALARASECAKLLRDLVCVVSVKEN
jgi:hypothetical protein